MNFVLIGKIDGYFELNTEKQRKNN
ncbi:hypothetical protein OS145_02965 [Idiomarina baltica OS145]|uniref:Uncharacterized protein n=1 Tax=Idiomarina baltica OS145 TaxID=314276 RepID=A0ABP2CU16_9GAMM|nr:hypothetical protein OS145_02965 [Idiomarina baltica OS145]